LVLCWIVPCVDYLFNAERCLRDLNSAIESDLTMPEM